MARDRDIAGIDQLLVNNRVWAQVMEDDQPGFFDRLAKQQAPKFLWIGCSDSRVPANEIVGLMPGELFVHRNVANMVHLSDLNCLSALQYAIEGLKVEHIILCGHYGCGGVKAAMRNDRTGLVDHWIRPIRELCHDHHHDIEHHREEAKKIDLLCELNVRRQVKNLCQTQIVQDAWARGQKLEIHTLIYDIHDGLLRQLAPPVNAESWAANDPQILAERSAS